MAFMTWGPRNAFDDLARLQREMTRWMEGPGGDRWPLAYPPLNVYDDGENFHVRAEVPGLNPDKVELSVAGEVLTLKADRPLEEANGSYHRRERSAGMFSRSINLPDTVDASGVRASYVNGVLEVTLPRAPEVRPRKISIEAR